MSKVSEGKKCCALPWTCIVQRARTREGVRCCNSTQLLQMSSVVSLVMRAPTLEKRGEEKEKKGRKKNRVGAVFFFQKQGDAVQTKSARCHQGAPPICLWVSVRSLGCTTIANASSRYARKYLYALTTCSISTQCLLHASTSTLVDSAGFCKDA